MSKSQKIGSRECKVLEPLLLFLYLFPVWSFDEDLVRFGDG